MIQFRNTKYQCSMELTLALIGGKWKSLILWRLGANTLRFSELHRSVPQVTQKMLTQQLRELEADGLVQRHVYTQVPPRVEYSLTAAGRSILPILESMCQWGLNYIAELPTTDPSAESTQNLPSQTDSRCEV